jgi:hydrogenase nickel incorporation protein HypA/HybF
MFFNFGMHEHNITNAVVHTIIHECEDHNLKNPKKITVELGLLTSYKKDSLLFYFEGIKKDIATLKDAELNIIEIPGKIKCKKCKKESIVEPSPLILCPLCQSANVKVLQGKDVVIKDIK